MASPISIIPENCLKERIGNQGQRVRFLGRRRISTSGFAYMATETAVFAVRSAKPCLSWDTCFLLVARSYHATGSRNIRPEVVFKVQKIARYALFCLIMGPFKGEVPVFARL